MMTEKYVDYYVECRVMSIAITSTPCKEFLAPCRLAPHGQNNVKKIEIDKYFSNKFNDMNKNVFFGSCLVLAAVLFIAGCTSSAPQAAATPVPTPIGTMAVSTTPLPAASGGGSTEPGPTQTVPLATAVSISVEKAGTYSTTIITHFDGGKGMGLVHKIDVRVTHPDGSVVTGTMKNQNGESLELPGTNGTDRVEVIVTMMSGDVYKVIDQSMPFKTRA
jgi:hypothetical protein